MRIQLFTDLRFTCNSRPTGVGKHICQMARGLAVAGHQLSVLALRDQLGDHRAGTLSLLPANALPLPWKAAEALWTVTGHPLADRWCTGLDWVYCPKNDLIPLRNTRLAVTIHGAAELDPQMPRQPGLAAALNRWRRRTTYQRIVAHADAVLTVSEFLKQQVVDWFGADPDRVHVVGNGVEMEYFDAARQPVGLSGEPAERPFVLAIGGLNYLDGGDRVVAVASLLRRQMPELRVLVAGWQHRPEWQAQAEALGNVTLLGYVPSNRLAHYLRDAVALLFPTRYETFGIAAAEAMAAGTPVITCRSTAVPEIVGEAGIYYPPDDPHEAVSIIRQLMDGVRMRDELVRRGRERAALFTWAQCVERLARVLQTA